MGFFKSLPFRLLLGIVLGLLLGMVLPAGAMVVVVTVKYILGQLISFCVPLIIIGFIAPSITTLGNNATRILSVAITIAYMSSVLAACMSMCAGYAIIPHLYIAADPESLRADVLASALEAATLAVDFEQSPAARNASYRAARDLLKPALSAVSGTTVPQFYAVGNAHLDLAWLWPMDETFRKTSRTFAAQLRLMEEYPEYRYIQSQPAAYEMCREHYPELYERIRKAAAAGQWIPEGAMWVEPDTNMTSGESLVRQVLHGKRYFRDVFGVDSVVLWLPDTFGYSAALPQILKSAGVKYLVTQIGRAHV